jgi:serine protease Do
VAHHLDRHEGAFFKRDRMMMEQDAMTQSIGSPENGAAASRPILSKRRLALLATAAGLGAAVVFSSPSLPVQPVLPTFGAPAHAQTAMRPASFADVVEKVKPAVFAVRVKVEDRNPQMSQFGGEEMPFPPGSPMERFFKRFGFGEGPEGMRPRGPRGEGQMPGRRQFSMAQGSGFFISADGYAVTNNHVVERGQSIEIKMDDGKTYDAKVIGADPRTDLALIKVEGRNDFPFVRFAPKSPRVGDWVLAVGNPFGLGGTVTAGIVSASGRDIGAGPYDDFIQIDAPVNRGNSGGPTFDVDGNVIGVNTAIYSPSGGNVGIAFAIPSDTVQAVVAQLKDKGQVVRGWIGVQIQPVTAEIAESLGLKEVRGALVADPQADGPAAKAGIQSGDVILSVNGNPVMDARDLAKRIGGLMPGDQVKLGVFRKGAEQFFSLTLGTLPGQRQANARPSRERELPNGGVPQLGLSLAPAASVAGAGGAGVVVTEVDPAGPAAERGLKTGDVIVEVGGKAVANPADVRKALEEAREQGKRTVLMRVKTGDATRFVALPVSRA